jgi:hypothetical protein
MRSLLNLLGYAKRLPQEQFALKPEQTPSFSPSANNETCLKSKARPFVHHSDHHGVTTWWFMWSLTNKQVQRCP